MTLRSPLVRPQGIYRINRGQRLSRGLAFYTIHPGGTYIVDAVSGQLAASSAGMIASPWGPALNCISESTVSPSFPAGFAPLKGANNDGSGDVTLAAVCNPASGAFGIVAGQGTAAGSLNQCQLLINADATESGAAGVASFFMATTGVSWGAQTDSAAVDGNWHVLVGRQKNLVSSIWQDGVDKTSSTRATSAGWFVAGCGVRVGSFYGAEFNLPVNSGVVVTAGWNRALSNEEIEEFSRDIWRPLRGFNFQPVLFDFVGIPGVAGTTYASSFYNPPPPPAKRLPDYQAAFWAPRTVVNAAPPTFAIPPGLDAANPRAAARLVEYAASFWDPRTVTNAAPPAFAIPVLSDLPPRMAARLVEYQAQAWNPLGGYTNPAPPKFAIPVLSDLPPRAAQRLVEYPSFFWGPRVIPAPPVTYASSFYDLPPKVAQRLAVYEAAWWNPARFVDAAPPQFAIPVLTDLPPVMQAPRRLVEYQAQFWNPLGGPFNGPPPAFAIPPGMDAANPRAAARLAEYAAAFWNPMLVVNAAPPAFSIPSFTDVPKAAARPAFYEQPAWSPQPFDIRYASVFDQLPPYAQKRLVEYQATFLALPVPPPPTSTPSALWQPQYPDLLLPAARLPDYSFFVLPYADYGGSITPPPDTGLPQPIYGFWINARKRARHIAKQTNVKAAIGQEINRALADLKEHDAAATERAFSRILAAEAVLQQQKYLKGLLEAHALETRLVAARRAAELAQEEQDINDLLGKL